MAEFVVEGYDLERTVINHHHTYSEHRLFGNPGEASWLEAVDSAWLSDASG